MLLPINIAAVFNRNFGGFLDGLIEIRITETLSEQVSVVNTRTAQHFFQGQGAFNRFLGNIAQGLARRIVTLHPHLGKALLLGGNLLLLGLKHLPAAIID